MRPHEEDLRPPKCSVLVRSILFRSRRLGKVANRRLQRFPVCRGKAAAGKKSRLVVDLPRPEQVAGDFLGRDRSRWGDAHHPSKCTHEHFFVKPRRSPAAVDRLDPVGEGGVGVLAVEPGLQLTRQ